MDNENLTKLGQAIAAHRFDGRFSVGTAAIVESLHHDFGYSYEKIANISEVTTAGVRRWRERNSGDKSRFEVLLKYAENIVSGKALYTDVASVPSPAAVIPNPGQQRVPSHEVSSIKPLSIAEAKQGLAMMFSIDANQIEILIKG